jgi:hypothetical protein
MIDTRKAKQADAKWFAPLLRKEDIKEIEATNRFDIQKVLEDSIKMSDFCHVFVDKDEDNNLKPIAIFGLMKVNSETAIPWLLGTDEIPKNIRQLWPTAKQMVSAWSSMFRVLVNAVHADHKESITFLEHLGFERTISNTMEETNETFHRYELTRRIICATQQP